MVTEQDSVEAEEFILRRILNLPNWVDLTLSRPIQGVAFSPTDKDADGISVFREQFTTPEAVAKTGANPAGYYVARLQASELIGLGLSITPDPLPPDSGPRGHALVPEMCSGMDKPNERALRAKLVLLINLDWQNRIVYTP